MISGVTSFFESTLVTINEEDVMVIPNLLLPMHQTGGRRGKRWGQPLKTNNGGPPIAKKNMGFPLTQL
jgi:hypothetical protein